MTSVFFELEGHDAAGGSTQRVASRDSSQRFEGVAFSPSGDVLGVATSDTNAVLLFRRGPDRRFEDEPSWSLCGPELDYPHDISFCRVGGAEFFAVAQRGGSISIFRRDEATGLYDKKPAFRISGPEAKLKFSDGVAFVPPGQKFLAACNLETDLISFYRRKRALPLRFGLKPSFELRGGSLCRPDGLAFSECGEWLAVANHGNHTVGVFQRRKGILSARRPRYGPEPATVIRDPGLRYPHSVAFTPLTNHLVVTNAGANYFSVYGPPGGGSGWTQTPVLRKTVGPSSVFEEVNACNKMEGGPKGVAVHGENLAVCSPGFGVMIYSFRERVS